MASIFQQLRSQLQAQRLRASSINNNQIVLLPSRLPRRVIEAPCQQWVTSFSTTTPLAKRKDKGNRPQIDKRITLIRYFLYHPLTPRPLRFSRTRYLRHWTIHRAWNLHQAQLRRARHLELERQFQAMRDACEELRTGVGDGGRLFRIAMDKRSIFSDLVPIEYARFQTDAPAAEGEVWNYAWRRKN